MDQGSTIVGQNHIACGIDLGRQSRRLPVLAQNIQFFVTGMMGNNESIAVGRDKGPQD
jgi:hypothetical protein